MRSAVGRAVVVAVVPVAVADVRVAPRGVAG